MAVDLARHLILFDGGESPDIGAPGLLALTIDWPEGLAPTTTVGSPGTELEFAL